MSKEIPTEYFITDGTQYVSQDFSGKYRLTSNSSLAATWNSPKMAESVLNNAISKAQRMSLYVGYLENGEIVHCTLSQREKNERKKKITTQDANDKKIFRLKEYSFEDDKAVHELIEGFFSVRDSLEQYSNTYRTLENELIRLDYMLEDIKHYRGYKKLNARDGYKLHDVEQKIFLQRVSIKNQMEIVKKFEKYYSSIIDGINDICETIDKLRDQVYKPRVLISLFENNDFSVNL